MSLFDAFKKINDALAKVQPPANKSEEKKAPQEESSQPAPSASLPKKRYRKLAYWLKQNYGDKFRKDASTDELQRILTEIFKKDIEPNYRSEPKYVKGFKNYIEQRQYGDLVSVE